MRVPVKMIRLLRGVALAALTVCLLALTGRQVKKQDDMPCNAVLVGIDTDNGMAFIDSADVLKLLENTLADSLLNRPLHSIPVAEMEAVVLSSPYADQADVYLDAVGNIHVDVVQKQPIARIINKNGVHYYMDEKANKFPVHPTFTCRVPVVTGNISESLSEGDTIQSAELKNAYEIIMYMNTSDLWKAQLEQLQVRGDGVFEFVPKIGGTVVLGKAEDLESKLDKLELFYREGLNYTDWDRYSRIDLTYRDQIVCTKKQAWE
ncbi:MAG TPA: hypothetical protein DCG24_03710 [Bacteroidetes bacterium]|nr:hypothetical protein [Bacteroidota bacterium]HQU38566.1 hypothetical protein [Chitinophagales bacterium]